MKIKKWLPRLIGAGLNGLALAAPQYAAAKAFNLFCHPRRPKLAAYHHAFLSTAEAITFRLRDLDVRGYKWGEGPQKILFLHGWQSHSFRWKAYIEKLDKKAFTVFAIDAPGHGLTSGDYMTVPLYAEVITAFIDRIGEPDSVVGHSLGCFTALYLLHSQPDRAPRKLVLLAPPRDVAEFFDVFRDTLGISERLIKELKQYFLQRIGRPVEYYSATMFARGLTMDGLIIHDRGDEDTHYTHAVAIHDVWPASRLILTDGLGHNLKSKDIVETVVAFLASRKEVGVTSQP